MAVKPKGERKSGDDGDPPICGVIMPISSTANHVDKHWAEVQVLLHRAITFAGFRPQNVWENSSTDRVSERIIANIFELDIVVADISDLNPNVMLELGLRLASKKPTIVIVNAGGTIPFDIRDFYALDYPADMNMLAMEVFFAKISKILLEKFQAFKDGTYTPFLGNVVIDVLSPQEREVTSNQLVISRLDEISSRFTRVEDRLRHRDSNNQLENENAVSGSSGRIFVSIPNDKFDDAHKVILEMWEPDRVRRRRVVDEYAICEVDFSAASDMADFRTRLREALDIFGGKPGIHRP